MSAPKAKGTTLVDTKLRKAKKRIEELQAESTQLRMSVVNMRQMYDSSIGEKNQLQALLENTNQILVAAVAGSRGKTITIKKKVIDNIANFAGLDTKDADGDLVLTALTVAEVQAMQDEIDDEV